MHTRRPRLRRAAAVRLALIAFVVVWLLGPRLVRDLVPVWIPFLLALGLEAHFFVSALRPGGAGQRPDRRPQDVDRERYGYADDADDMLLVERGDEELWIPYAGETGDELEELVARRAAATGEPPPPVPAAVRTRRFGAAGRFVAGVALIAALAAVAWLADTRSGWDGVDDRDRATAVARFSSEASRIVGRPVDIRCDEAGEHVGIVQHADGAAVVGGRVAYLTPELCHDLYRLLESGDAPFSTTARALAVLSHEAWHLRGVRDEGETECYALQSGVDLGTRLGLDEETARRMMRQQLVENARRDAATAEYRLPAGCRDGGALDLKPQERAFP